MSEEEKKAIEYLEQERAYAHKLDNRKIVTIITIALKLIRNRQKELNNLKEIEKSHKEENGKLRVELEQEKEKNNDLETDYILCAMDRKNHYVSKDKIKEKIEETNNEKLNYSEDEYYLENEIKGYAIDKLKELLEEK